MINIAHPACPLSKEKQPKKCKRCPLPLQERIDTCKFFNWNWRAQARWITAFDFSDFEYDGVEITDYF